MVTNPLAPLPLVLTEGNTRRSHVATVTGHYHVGMSTLSAELVNNISGLSPVGVDQNTAR